jgi:hypothetical protein
MSPAGALRRGTIRAYTTAAMRFMKAMTGVMVLSILALGLGMACSGDDKGSEEPSAGVSPEATESTEATKADGQLPDFTGGTASATLSVAGRTLTFDGGHCTRGSDNEWLIVYIDEVVGEKFLGLTAGKSPALEDARSAQGGGEFVEGDFFVWWASEGSPSYLREGTLTLASDLGSGDFEGNLDDEEVTGSFACH